MFLSPFYEVLYLLLKKIPYYYAANEVKLPGIKAVFITDDNTAYQAFQSAYAKFHLARPENCRLVLMILSLY